MDSKRMAALTTLRVIETTLAGQLSRAHRAGRRVDTPFVRALSEIHSLLATGLNAVLPRFGLEPLSNPVPFIVRPDAAQVGLRGVEPQDPALAWREKDFLLDYGYELCCLQRESKVALKFAPCSLRAKKASAAEEGSTALTRGGGESL